MKAPTLSEITLGASLLMASGCAAQNAHLNSDFFGDRSRAAAQAETEFVSSQVVENCLDLFAYACQEEPYTDEPIGLWQFEAPEAGFMRCAQKYVPENVCSLIPEGFFAFPDSVALECQDPTVVERQ